MTLRHTAIHEASHVVLVCATLGPRHVGRVRLREPSDRGLLGTTTIKGAPSLAAVARVRMSFPKFGELTARHMIAILVAGHIGTHIDESSDPPKAGRREHRRKRPLRFPLRGDISFAASYAIGLPAGVFAQEVRRTRNVLVRHWSHVEALARALVRRRTLSGLEVLTVLARVGRIRRLVRRDLDAIATAEVDAAIRAHRSQG